MNERKFFLTNNLYVLSNKIISKIITFGIIVYATRILPKESFGTFALLILLSGIFTAIHDFGSSIFLVREIARNKSVQKKYLITTILGKIFFAPVISFLFIMFPLVLNLDKEINNYTLLFSISMISQSLLLTITKSIEGSEDMRKSSLLIILERMLTVIFFIIFNYYLPLIKAYALAILISNSLVFFAFIVSIYQFHEIKNLLEYKIFKKLISRSKLFWVFTLIGILYAKFDIFYVASVFNNTSVATYRANFQLIEALYFLPINLGISFLPFFSRLFFKDKDFLNSIYSRVFKQFLYFSMFLGILIFIKSDLIISLLYSKYSDSSYLLAILSFAIPFFFFTSLNGNLLIASGKEKVLTYTTLITTAIKVGAILLFAYKFGIISIAIIYVVAEVISFLIQFIFIKKNNFNVYFNKQDIKYIIYFLILFLVLFYIQNLVAIVIISSFFFLLIMKDFIQMVFSILKTG